jgi:CRISPR/Cas system-associated exonuclease Cas4 (RecB family)
VKLGEILDEQSYQRKNKRRVGDSQMDFVESGGTIKISEVKKSSSHVEADRLQLLHYMNLLDIGYSDAESKEIIGVIRYPEERNTKEIEWNDKNKDEYEESTNEIVDIVNGECPKPEWKNACKKCSMREFCFA